MRSPGLWMGPAVADEGTSPTGEMAGGFVRSGSVPSNAGGVKRTKSLMQKLKTMVRTRSGSVEGASSQMASVHSGGEGLGPQRFQSMSAGFGGYQRPLASPGWADREVVEEEEMMEEDEGGDRFDDARDNVFNDGGGWGGGQEKANTLRPVSEFRQVSAGRRI